MPGESGSLSYEHKTFWLALLITVVLGSIIWLVLYLCKIPLDVDDVTSIYTFCLLLFTLLFYSKSLHAKYNQYTLQQLRDEKREDERLRLEKLHYTYNVLDDWYMSPTLVVERKYASKAIEAGTPKQILDHLKDTPEDEDAVKSILNYFEYVSVLLDKELIEEQATQALFKSLFLHFNKHFRPYIEYRQRERGPRIFMAFVRIASKWAQE